MLLLLAAENDGTSLYEIMRAGEVLLAEDYRMLHAFEPAVSVKLIDLDAAEARFRHPLVRSAIHQAADPGVRQKVHAALAGVIEDQDRRFGIVRRRQWVRTMNWPPNRISWQGVRSAGVPSPWPSKSCKLQQN